MGEPVALRAEEEQAFAAERARPMRVRLIAVVAISTAIWISQVVLYEDAIFPVRADSYWYRASELFINLALALLAWKSRSHRQLEWGAVVCFSGLTLAHGFAMMRVEESCVLPFTLTMEWGQMVTILAAMLSFWPSLILLGVTLLVGTLATAARAKWDLDLSDHAVLALIYGVVLLSIRHFDRLRRGEFSARTRLETANHALREAERARSWLFQNLSHDFRTPLALIQAEAELLERRGQHAELAGLSRIRANALALADLTSELLQLAKLESGSRSRDPRSFDVVTLLREVAVQFTRGTLNVTVDAPQAEVGVLADVGHARRVFANLVSNAARAARARVQLVVTCSADLVAIDVVDDGPGVPEPHRAAVFERFVSFDSAGGVGTGIGLPLARELCELNGGTLTLEPAPQTTFRVRLPVARTPLELLPAAAAAAPADPREDAAAVANAARPEPSAPARSLLVVEDNPDMCRLLKGLLGQHFSIQAAGSVAAALELLPNLTPSAILCDVMLPDGEGYAVLERVRAEPRLDGVPLLFVSALAGVEHRTRGLTAGADDYVTKPFTTAELLARLNVACGRAEERRKALQMQRQGFLAELHDGVTASLSRAALLLGSAQADGDEQVVTAALESVREGLEESRNLLSLVDTGTSRFDELTEKIRRELAVLDGFGVAGRLDVASDGSTCLLSAVEAHALTRAAREGLTNAIKHASARTVVIHLQLDDGRVQLRVEDDGQGRTRAHEGHGLGILRRRVQRLAGSVSEDRSALGGMRLSVELPLMLASHAAPLVNPAASSPSPQPRQAEPPAHRF